MRRFHANVPVRTWFSILCELAALAHRSLGSRQLFFPVGYLVWPAPQLIQFHNPLGGLRQPDPIDNRDLSLPLFHSIIASYQQWLGVAITSFLHDDRAQQPPSWLPAPVVIHNPLTQAPSNRC